MIGCEICCDTNFAKHLLDAERTEEKDKYMYNRQIGKICPSIACPYHRILESGATPPRQLLEAH